LLHIAMQRNSYFIDLKEKTGAAGGDRTHDPWLRRPILYPLSYSRVGKSEVSRRIQAFPVPVYGKWLAALPYVPNQDLWVYNRPFGGICNIARSSASAGRAAGFFNCIKEIMSDAHNEHQSFIRTPKQLIAAVAGFFLVIVIGIILLVSFATSSKLTGAGSEGQSANEVARRVQPVAEQGFTLKDANAPKVLQNGQSVYTAVCAACHGTGAAGAPKLGDSGAWGPRLAAGFDTLVQHAVHGIRAMPAKGGNPDLDDIEVARAVAYMANQSGAKFKEPEGATPAPAAVGATASGTAPMAVADRPAAPAASAPATAAAPAASAPAAAPAASADAGKTLYTNSCATCHGPGIAGAPKFGDKAAWAPRIQQGNAVLYDHAIKGFQGKAGMMPPKGGSTAPDSEVKAAVDYMTAAAK
jgi:cytochrome c5